jgi:hypothetical protein
MAILTEIVAGTDVKHRFRIVRKKCYNGGSPPIRTDVEQKKNEMGRENGFQG